MKAYNFTLKEFMIEPDQAIPVDAADKIYHWHIPQLQAVRDVIELPIQISKRSGYRPYQYERRKGRAGNSQHCFGERPDGSFDKNHRGAVDLTCSNMAALLKELKDCSPYTRICYYPNNNFIHCDYGTEDRNYYEADSPAGRWVFKERLL